MWLILSAEIRGGGCKGWEIAKGGTIVCVMGWPAIVKTDGGISMLEHRSSLNGAQFSTFSVSSFLSWVSVVWVSPVVLLLASVSLW